MVKVKSVDLQKGDIIHFADIRDEVLGVTKSGLTLRVDVLRRFTDGRKEQPAKTFIWCGVKSVQDVERASV